MSVIRADFQSRLHRVSSWSGESPQRVAAAVQPTSQLPGGVYVGARPWERGGLFPKQENPLQDVPEATGSDIAVITFDEYVLMWGPLASLEKAIGEAQASLYGEEEIGQSVLEFSNAEWAQVIRKLAFTTFREPGVQRVEMTVQAHTFPNGSRGWMWQPIKFYFPTVPMDGYAGGVVNEAPLIEVEATGEDDDRPPPRRESGYGDPADIKGDDEPDVTPGDEADYESDYAYGIDDDDFMVLGDPTDVPPWLNLFRSPAGVGFAVAHGTFNGRQSFSYWRMW